MIATSRRENGASIGTDDPRAARAAFTLRETAAYLGLPGSTLHSWARPDAAATPLITCFPAHGREATVPFIGFAEAYVLSAFRRAGVPMQRIRPAVEVLSSAIERIKRQAKKPGPYIYGVYDGYIKRLWP